MLEQDKDKPIKARGDTIDHFPNCTFSIVHHRSFSFVATTESTSSCRMIVSSPSYSQILKKTMHTPPYGILGRTVIWQ
jgi:hypothetical protein